MSLFLRLNSTNTERGPASVFKQGYEAENFNLRSMGNIGFYRINKAIRFLLMSTRTFFDNSRAALAKSAEGDYFGMICVNR